MEGIILAGGKAERLGAAAGGRPKSLVLVAGRPLAAYQVGLLASAGVDRVLVSCAAGEEEAFEAELAGLGPEIVAVPEPEPLGRGGGLRLAAGARRESSTRLPDSSPVNAASSPTRRGSGWQRTTRPGTPRRSASMALRRSVICVVWWALPPAVSDMSVDFNPCRNVPAGLQRR